MTTTNPSAADAVLAALSAHPGTTAAELAEEAAIGRSTAGKALAALEKEGKAIRTPGAQEGARRLPDRWCLTPAPEEGTPAVEKPGRLGKGQLREMVLMYLRAHPGQAFSPTAIAKAMGHSAGAIGNALNRLTDAGEVTQKSTTPRRYAAAS
jgi:DNA-binding MarR family transcriptional regulator